MSDAELWEKRYWSAVKEASRLLAALEAEQKAHAELRRAAEAVIDEEWESNYTEDSPLAYLRAALGRGGQALHGRPVPDFGEPAPTLAERAECFLLLSDEAVSPNLKRLLREMLEEIEELREIVLFLRARTPRGLAGPMS